MDSSLGQTGQPLVTSNGNGANDYGINTSLGKQISGNVFLSFSQFGLATGESASFSGPGSVRNILARVTGGQLSSIDGTIRSSISGANLYLVNPSGVVFGPDASLDLSGAFVVSTADYLKQADGGRFDSVPSSNDATLSASEISAFGFLSSKPASISVQGSVLTGASGARMLFVGGDLSLSDSKLTAAAGMVGLWSVNSAGEIAAADGAGTLRGNIVMAKSRVEATGNPGGSVVIRGGKLVMNRSSIVSETQGAAAGGGIDLRVTGAVSLADFSRIASFTSSSGAAGDVSLHAGSVDLSGNSFIGSQALSQATIAARTGKVNVTTGNLSIASESSIASTTFGPGAGSLVNVNADSISVVGDSSGVETGIFSSTYASGGSSGGAGGNVQVHAKGLQILSGGAIAADTFGYAPGGDVEVHASNVEIAAHEATLKTGIFADSLSTGAGGKGGSVHLVAGKVQITDGGLISTKTLGLGRGGDTELNVNELFISRGSSSFYTGLAADTALPGLRGAGGNIRVNADTVKVVDGGQISANTFGLGAGGDIRVSAHWVELTGRPGSFTGISADSLSTSAGGRGGDIVVAAAQLRIKNGGRISANTFGGGAGGDVLVDAADTRITAEDATQFTGIAATSAGTGIGGSITVDAKNLSLSHGSISASAIDSDAGSILIKTRENLTLKQQSGITTSAGRDGGNIQIQSKGTVYLLNSSITATAGTLLSGNQLAGAGGNIFIDPQFVVLNNSVISANAAIGRGGNINIVAENFLRSESQITATGAQEGTVVISAPELDLSGGLVGLSASMVDVSSRLQERCTMSLQGDFSSFVTLGRGGVASDPEEQQLSFAPELPENAAPKPMPTPPRKKP